MDSILLYLIKSNLSLIVLFALYILVLRKQPFFKLSRVFLLCSVLASALIPLIDFSSSIQSTLYYVQLPDVVVESGQSASANSYNYINLLFTVYIGISFAFIIKLFLDFRSIYLMRKRSKPLYKEESSVRLWLNPYQNFSFFNWVFICEKDKDNQVVIDHEISHSRLLHSLDIVFIKIFQSLFWFNPLTFLIERELRLQHEYEVDQLVLSKHNSIPDYQQMLLDQVFQTEFNLVTNNFNQSFLKNRFTMMTKKVNKKRSPLFISMILVMAVMVPVLFSCSMEKSEVSAPETETKITDQKSEEAPENVQSEQIEDANTDETFIVVEDMPVFPGGEQAMYQYIGNNLKYPEEAKLAGVQGTVFIEFIVEKDGSITNVKAIKEVGHGCDEAAIEVIEGMPQWTPGKQRGKAVRVAYRLPLSFKLQ